jgi:hypothetical protein
MACSRDMLVTPLLRVLKKCLASANALLCLLTTDQVTLGSRTGAL